MEKMSVYTFLAAVVSMLIATILYEVNAFASRRQLVLATSGGPGRGVSSSTLAPSEFGAYGSTLATLSFAFLSASLISRAIATGHGPYSNMYEFSIAFAWGITGAYLFFELRYHVRALGALVLPIAFILMLYAASLPSEVQPLVPALQNNLFLTVHVAMAIIAYGTFTVAFGSAALFLIRNRVDISWLPNADVLDEVGYRSVIVGFPFMALVLILGAIWADTAWGSYWSWDPKETAALVTWLIYGGYLHAKAVRGWRGTRSAVLLLVGFGATLITYFGNYFFGGLHSYAGF